MNPPAVAPGPGDPPGEGRPDLVMLLRRCARGEEQAFAPLYDATSRRVFGIVLRVVRNPALAEEVTQEVYLEVWRTSARFDDGAGTPLAWLMTIAHRRAVDRVRATESATRNEVAYENTSRPVDHDVTAETAEANLDARRVRAALDGLTTTQREAVELAYFGGYTHREVAQTLDLPLGTAKTRIRDGLIRMRDTMGVTQA